MEYLNLVLLRINNDFSFNFWTDKFQVQVTTWFGTYCFKMILLLICIWGGKKSSSLLVTSHRKTCIKSKLINIVLKNTLPGKAKQMFKRDTNYHSASEVSYFLHKSFEESWTDCPPYFFEKEQKLSICSIRSDLWSLIRELPTSFSLMVFWGDSKNSCLQGLGFICSEV